MSTTSSRRLAIAVGVASSACALVILMQDAVRTGVVTIEHILIPGMVAIAISAGHLVGAAVRSRKPFSAVGFAIAFSLATLLTVYTSVSKQADVSETVASAVEVSNEARQTKSSDLTRARLRFEEATAQAEREMTGQRCLGRCQDWKIRASEVAARIEKLEGELRTMQPPRPIAVGAARMAKVISIVSGQDEQRVKAMLILLEPFAKALLFELTAIVAFGFGFGHERTMAIKQPANANEPAPGSPGVVIDWVRAFRKRHGRNPRIPELQRQFPGTSKTTAWRRCKAA